MGVVGYYMFDKHVESESLAKDRRPTRVGEQERSRRRGRDRSLRSRWDVEGTERLSRRESSDLGMAAEHGHLVESSCPL